MTSAPIQWHIPGCAMPQGYAFTCACHRPHSATDTHDLIERAAHLARLGWAVEKLKAQGSVEFTLAQIEDAARLLEWPDLAHAHDKGGDALDGPVLLTDEPTGDAMTMTFNRDDRLRGI